MMLLAKQRGKFCSYFSIETSWRIHHNAGRRSKSIQSRNCEGKLENGSEKVGVNRT